MPNKINDYVWEIPEGTEEGMRVPIRIYASETILGYMQRDRTLKQAMNASKLPSIQKRMMVMPDGHEGYGFPVGGVAAFDADDGIVSPGICGYDINCLPPEANLLSKNGYFVKIKDISKHPTVTFCENGRLKRSRPLVLMGRKEKNYLLKIKILSGKEIRVTADHPILTDKGMVKAEYLSKNSRIAVYGFSGVEYSEPNGTEILNEEILTLTCGRMGIKNNGTARILNNLRLRKLDNIKNDDKRLPTVLRLLGMIFGDGSIPNSKHHKYGVSIYGKREDLEVIKSDVQELGFKCLLRSRYRHHKIKTHYSEYEFDYNENYLIIANSSFATLMVALGAPYGNKTITPYRIPGWILTSELWQKRLFIASYFGTEMSKPITHNGYNFQCPTFSVNKILTLEENAIDFLIDIKKTLNEFDIDVTNPTHVSGYAYDGKHGETKGFRLSIRSNTQNLMRFFNTIGYEYNIEKMRLGSLAVLFLGYLESARTERYATRSTALMMTTQGIESASIVSLLSKDNTSKGFIEHTIWGRKGKPRIYGSLHFSEFCSQNEIGKSGLIYDSINSIEKESYCGNVYDIMVDNEEHNFIADGIVVSNCGVKLIKTNLSVADVRPKLSVLMDSLFKNVPSGVGSKMNIGFTRTDLERVSMEGVDYIIEKGYGNKEDKETIEEYGLVAGADMSAVSPLAKKRGLHEIGTLGAGNHFLEVQKVDKIADAEKGKAFGLEEGQVVVMLHCGSRGFGHQICSDNLRVLSEYQQRNNIKLDDPELIYAKIGSREADNYLKGMRCAINFAFVNRQVITNSIRKSFVDTFGKSADALGMEILYDVAHNIVKLEEHAVDGKRKKLYVHRKGATRAFGPGNPEVTAKYRAYGQPVLIPGSMGSASYVLAGRQEAMDETFGSSCHGSGRVMSRHQAIRDIPASRTLKDLDSKNIVLRIRNKRLISEEAEWAYKDVDDVVASISKSKISDIVARLVPLGVTKG
jgi:tRNA-splicing ligase RtcB